MEAAMSAKVLGGEATSDVVDNKDNDKRTYLLEIYKAHVTHINTMFNFFLVAAGLIGNAYIQSFLKTIQISPYVSVCIAMLGTIFSLMFFLIDQRSREMLNIVGNSLSIQEDKLFTEGDGFYKILNKQRKPWFLRHRYQFPLTYLAFMLVFGLATVYALAYAGIPWFNSSSAPPGAPSGQ
jgi:hypothetical protein